MLHEKTVFNGSEEKQIVYEYDDYGKVKKITYPDTPTSGYIEFEYTSRNIGKYGKVSKITDHRIDSNRPGDLDTTYEFEYDDYPVSSQITSYTVKNSSTSYDYQIQYDYSRAYGRKTGIQVYNLKDNADSGDDEKIYDVIYDYDMAGRLVAVRANNGSEDIAGLSYYPDGTRQQLTYELNGGTTLETSYDYNPDNALTYIDAYIEGSADSLYLFNATSTGAVDGLGRLNFADEQIENTGGTVTHELDFYYETAGKPGYDMRSQLLTASISNIDGGTWSASYSYKKDGNIDSKDSTSFTYTGDLMTSGEEDYDWDENGRLEEKDTSAVTFIYNWDGKLSKAYLSSDNIHLKYDPMGNRVWKNSTVNGERKYIIDITGRLPVILMELNTSETVIKSYIYENSRIIAQRDGDQTATKYFYVNDRLGSVRQVIDMSGSVKRNYTYSPFGQLLESGTASGAPSNPFMFTGQWFDDEISQYYLRARMYDPTLMRFTARDPVRGKFEDPLTLHPYLYCLSDPLNRADPSGRIAALIGGSLSFSGGEAAHFAYDKVMKATRAVLGKSALSRAISVGMGLMARNAYTMQAVNMLGKGAWLGKRTGGTLGAGVAFGRNVFQSKDPTKMLEALSKIVHHDYTIEEVLKEHKFA